jgi:hypothetical protein
LAKPAPQELTKRRTHSPECKARWAIDAINDRMTLQAIVDDYAIGIAQCSAPPIAETYSRAPQLSPQFKTSQPIDIRQA